MHANTVLVAVHWRIDLSSVLILLCISKPHLVQAGLNMSVANHTRAWTHCKNGGYCCFMCLCPVVIRKSIPVSEYWHKYPALKLSSIHVTVL